MRRDTVHEWFARHVTLSDLVALGDTVAPMSDWAHALDVPLDIVRSRIANGDMAFQALRSHRAGRKSVEVRHHNDPESLQFVDEHPHGATRHEVAAFFSLSPERVRQIENSGLGKMREALGAKAPEHASRTRETLRIRELIASGVETAAIVERVGVNTGRVYRMRTEMKVAS